MPVITANSPENQKQVEKNLFVGTPSSSQILVKRSGNVVSEAGEADMPFCAFLQGFSGICDPGD